MRDVNIILNSLDVVAPLIAILIFLYKPRKIAKELWPIFGFCVVQFVCNLTASIMVGYEIKNYWVYKVNTVLTFYFILYFFIKYLLSLKKYFVGIIVTLFLVAISILYYVGDGTQNFDSNSAALAGLIIVGLCLYFFYHKLINSSEEVSVPETAVFWCIVGIFTYYAGGFFIFISYKYLIHSDPATIGTVWRFHNLLLLICCLYIGYGVLCKNYRTT